MEPEASKQSVVSVADGQATSATAMQKLSMMEGPAAGSRQSVASSHSTGAGAAADSILDMALSDIDAATAKQLAKGKRVDEILQSLSKSACTCLPLPYGKRN